MEKRENISMSIIKRLPRYYRFLQSLKDNGIVRISSKELADRMGLTASQIRHDFNSFGGFGQQGYGYNVPELQKRIGEILCVDKELKTILIGASATWVRRYPTRSLSGRAALSSLAFLTRTKPSAAT